jgi:hypothetical protein
MVFPIVLGSGRRLFGEAPLSRFALASSQPVGPDGVIVLTYVRRSGRVAPGGGRRAAGGGTLARVWPRHR